MVPTLVAGAALLGSLSLAHAVPFEDASADLGGARVVSLPLGGTGYSGVAFLDSDDDGDLDLYLGNGQGAPNWLLRNDGLGHFEDIARDSGAAVWTGTGGVLAADLDNDGHTDLVLAGDRSPLVVLRNDGDGTFTDVTAAVGITGPKRSVSTHAADVDGDGLLDIFVTAGPFRGDNLPNALWMNRGDGTYEDRASAAGVDSARGACAATFTHLDDDDAIDLIVVNCSDFDIAPGRVELYRNRGDGTFEDLYDSSLVWELGFWMGLALADFDGDERMDFFVTNGGTTRGQPHALYRNNGDGTWTDIAAQAGVGDHIFGWGAVPPDLDADGWPDLYYVGTSHGVGHPSSPGLLLRNLGEASFAPPEIPLDISALWTSGLAHGDVDGNGTIDLVAVTTEVPEVSAEGTPVLLRNLTTGHSWLTLQLESTTGNRGAVGARIRAQVGDRVQIRELHAGSSYKSTNTPWPTFGLGGETEATVCVRWPGGVGEDFGALAANQRVRLVEGAGIGAVPCLRAEPPPPGPTGDTGAPTAPTGDTSEPERPAPEPTPDASCGCAQAVPPGPAPLLLWVLLSAARRRGTARGSAGSGTMPAAPWAPRRTRSAPDRSA